MMQQGAQLVQGLQEDKPLLLQKLGWQRPRPPAPLTAPLEWQWLHVGPNTSLLWNSTMAADDSSVAIVRGLLHKALVGPLLPSQQQAALKLMDADPQAVFALQLHLQPQLLPDLVEHTPMLAYHMLQRLVGSRRVEDLYQVLAHMPLSLHSMEVVNRLTSGGYLPAEVVHLYISNCINSCDDIPDLFLQNRLVRLVCVFLQSLIRSRMIDIAELLLEVQAFCVKYSRVREAATLFRVLKQMEHGGSLCSSPVSAPSLSTAEQGQGA